MSYSDPNLEKLKSIYNNNYNMLLNLNGSNGCLSNIITLNNQQDCSINKIYYIIDGQNKLMEKEKEETTARLPANIMKRKMIYDNEHYLHLSYINYLLTVFYYGIVCIFLLTLFYRSFISHKSKINFDYIKKFLYDYLFLILMIIFYPIYIRALTLLFIKLLNYIYSVIVTNVYFSNKYY
jgi:hypothetical protein